MDMKRTITEMEKLQERLSNRLELRDERISRDEKISKLEDSSTEIIPSEEQRKKNEEK